MHPPCKPAQFHARKVCAVEGANLRTPLAIARRVRYPSPPSKKRARCGLRSALCILFAFRGGFTRPHLCLYMRFRLFISAEIIFSLRSARQVCAVELRTLAHPACYRKKGALSLRFRHKKSRVQTRLFVAEAEGFEPPWACTQTVFKTASL